MAKKLDSIVELAAQKTREISANSGNYMAFLTTAAHNFKYNFRDQLLIYAQKPDATACAQIDFWNKHGRYVNQGTKMCIRDSHCCEVPCGWSIEWSQRRGPSDCLP